jgi:hypothetical protein
MVWSRTLWVAPVPDFSADLSIAQGWLLLPLPVKYERRIDRSKRESFDTWIRQRLTTGLIG